MGVSSIFWWGVRDRDVGGGNCDSWELGFGQDC